MRRKHDLLIKYALFSSLYSDTIHTEEIYIDGTDFLNLNSSVSVLKGVGEKRRKLYEKLNISTIGDLLEHYPRRYLDLTGSLSIADATEEEPCAIKAVVSEKTQPRLIRKGLSVSKVRVTDMEKDVLITFFNAKYTVEALEIGKEYIFFGEFEKRMTGGVMTSPQILSASECGMLPQYPLTEGLSSKIISTQMKEALEQCGNLVEDIIPSDITNRYGLLKKKDAVRAIHFPRNQQELEQAKNTLIFEEFYIFTLGINLAKGKNKGTKGPVFRKTEFSEFTENLGFELTNAQKRVIGECINDMSTGNAMNRLIQGDVGSGKTAVAAACMFVAVRNGYQAALMAPTEVLAFQHMETLSRMFSPFGIQVGLLTGSMKVSEKQDVKKQLASGDLDIVVGTHALIQDDVDFLKLGLIITDEQHRFGVKQRMALTGKGDSPHTIVMSATPIPRTLAFVLYGDLDISVLDEMPKNRKPVKTYLVGMELHQRVMDFVRKFAENGKQSYIVCPLIEQGENQLKLESAADLAERLTGQELVGCNVGLLHGKMTSGEKDRIMKAFSENRIQILVSTTVIEVGVDVPNAVCMVIENAERFGLSQLHQLRGRVGRGDEQSYCILISDSKSVETKKRLEVIAKTADGFAIAEEDLKLRGPGDFFGFRQSGIPMLKMADMMTDVKLLDLAKKESAELLLSDPDLGREENRVIRDRVRHMMESTVL